MRKLKYIVVHHSAVDQPNIMKAISSIDKNHKERLHPEKNGFGYHIAYHYFIGVDGFVFNTRPLDEIGYHASNLPVNEKSIGICLSGNFDTKEPTFAQYESLNNLIFELWDKFGKLEVHKHNEYAKKSCPGNSFNRSKILQMLKFEKLRNDKIKQIPQDKRAFKDPQGAFDYLMTLDNEVDQIKELIYLIAVISGEKK